MSENENEFGYMSIETIGDILENGSEEEQELLTPEDCLRFLSAAMDVPEDTLKDRYSRIKEGLPVEEWENEDKFEFVEEE